MTIAFHTKRLRVYRFKVQPNDGNIERDQFIGYRTDEDRPMPCVTCMVVNAPMLGGAYVDWIETSNEYRRMGFGREMIAGVRDCLQTNLLLDGGSESGEAFCVAMERESADAP